MSITWTISHPARLVVAVGRDEITATDVLFWSDGMGEAGVTSYRKLLDLTGVARMMPQADIRLVAIRVTARAVGWEVGAIAIVVASAGIAELVRIFEVTAASKRPFQIFRDLCAARAWLDEIAPP
jgi:hypothetical protein